jgi:protein-S-isoprenylcysteine O-methyltransferase Ste14
MPAVIAVYGVAAYAVFFATFLYAIGFVANLLVPKSIDLGWPVGATGEPLAISLLVDVALLLIFAVQHSVMARPAFKRWWTKVVPKAMERSTYVLLASAALILLFAQWRPVPLPVWNATGSIAGVALAAVSVVGWCLVLASTFMIDHFELFGLKQVWHRLRGYTAAPAEFRTPLVYRHVRHPIYLGFILAFWAAPAMSAGHLLFAVATTGYILLGIWFEERDLVALFGQRYRDYRLQAGMLLPRLRRAPPVDNAPAQADTPRSVVPLR